MNTPEDVVTAAFAAINTEDWYGLTAPCVVTCRKSGGSWQIIAKRNFFLMDSIDVVQVNPGNT